MPLAMEFILPFTLLDEFDRLDDSNKDILLKLARSMADAQEKEKKKRTNRK